MRFIVWLIVLFVVAVVAAGLLGTNDGLVTVYFRHWRVELSLNLFLLLIAGTCLAIMATLRTADSLVTLPRRAREWRALQRERAAQRALREALAEYFGARYSRSHKAAERALALQEGAPALVDDADFRILGQLLATASLHRLQDLPRRQESLDRLSSLVASQSARSVAEGARLMMLEWALDDRDAERALDLLAGLPPGVARRTQALRLKLQASRLARQPLQALHTAHLLANHRAFSPEAARGLLRSLAVAVLESARDAEQLRRQWAELEPADRRDPAILARAARRAVELGAPEEARQWLAPAWDDLARVQADERTLLARALSEATADIGPEWLQRVESAASAWPQDAAVNAAAALVYAERNLWGKARRPLEQAVQAAALEPRIRRRACVALATLLREAGDEARAAELDRQAAAMP
ncbi:MAG: heme biosynthesis HemY N-terminal domain-containing protein [Rubrivivax sp.]